MRELFFGALVERPNMRDAVQKQTFEAMRPFRRFLTQAIHTAKERQTRYELPWARVVGEVEYDLAPLDSALRVPSPPRGYLISGWPLERDPPLDEPLVVVNRRGAQVHVVRAERRGDLVRVETEGQLGEKDILFWDSVPCTMHPEEAAPRPSSLRRISGAALSVKRVEPAENDEHRVIVEGTVEDGETLIVDGREVRVHVEDPFEQGLQLDDAKRRTFRASGRVLRAEEPPEGELRGNNGLRYRASSRKGSARQGPWVELLPSESSDGEDLVDPRAAFCEADIEEVWTEPRHRKDAVYKVKRIDRERYQLLLDRYPPKGSHLFLPVDVHSLNLQRRAASQLCDGPLPHQRALVRLCENPQHVFWPPVQPVEIEQWYSLKDESRSGTEEQRRFVRKALGTPDLAILEGPPGSGKTTAICEIIQQLVQQRQRVLLCASTHVAIDNVLERLLDGEVPIDAVRVGKLDRVDEKVQKCQVDAKVDSLYSIWRSDPDFRKVGDAELLDMARRTTVHGADLTCGTTMGILRHPFFTGSRDGGDRDRPLCDYPHFDVLLIDEASKTLIQEFLVPALLARRHVIVGDVHQLPPFADRGDLVANLGALIDVDDNPIFTLEHQQACLLLHRLAQPRLRANRLRWLLVDRACVLDRLVEELSKDNELAEISAVRVVRRASPSRGRSVDARELPELPRVAQVTLEALRQGEDAALLVAAAEWVLVEDALLADAAPYLPSNVRVCRDLTQRDSLPEEDALLFRQAWWSEKNTTLSSPVWERGHEITTAPELEDNERKWIGGHSWAGEVAWRITREHELRWSKHGDEREKLRRGLNTLLPLGVDIEPSIGDVRDIGLPSILEVLQTGIGADRSHRPSALTVGVPRSVLQGRFESLSFQHRMHPVIADFARTMFYDGKALRDANTIESRDARLAWDFAPNEPARRVWIDVHGQERGGVNGAEIDALCDILSRFFSWAKAKGPPSREAPPKWEVACLCFYVKQEQAIRERLARLIGAGRPSSRYETDLVEIVCGTVDRFQGREADLVLLSMRNTRRIGFLDSPNRLNVALTRARQQLYVIGDARYFGGCDVSELSELVRSTRTRKPDVPSRGRR